MMRFLGGTMNWMPATMAHRPSKGTSDGVLDAQALDAIRAIPSPGLLRRMIKLYLEHAPRLLLEGRAAIDARECARIAVAVHQLKSSSANLGGRRLAAACKACETAARGDDFAAAERSWPRILAEYEAFRIALEDIQAEPDA